MVAGETPTRMYYYWTLRPVGKCGLTPFKVEMSTYQNKSFVFITACFNDGRCYRHELLFDPLVEVKFTSKSLGDSYVSLSISLEGSHYGKELLEYAETAIQQIQEALSSSYVKYTRPRY